MNLLNELRFLIPEIIVTAGVLIALVADAFLKQEERVKTPYLLVTSQVFALLSLVALAVMVSVTRTSYRVLWNTFLFDHYAIFLKALFLLIGIVTCFLAVHSSSISHQKAGGEFAALVGFSVVGGMIAASAGDFITLLVAVETVSLLGYVLAGFSRSRLAREAAVKYVLYGAFSTAISLVGLGMIFWATGWLEFKGMTLAVIVSKYKIFAFAGLVLFLVGLFFKASVVPFHMWCPDVYQGSPTLVTAYFSVGPKAVAFAALGRVLFSAFSVFAPSGTDVMTFAFKAPHGFPSWATLVAVASALTMTLGNLSALVQKDVKRMLAYSSIAHAGYILSAFAATSGMSVVAVLYYLLAYFLMNFGAFIVVEVVEDAGRGTSLDSLKGIGWSSPIVGVSMGVFLLSLTGIPPFAGFVGKLFVFGAIIKAKIYWLAVLGLLNSVISLGYYGLLLKKMFLEESESPCKVTPSYTYVISALAALTILLGIFFNPLLEYTRHAVKTLGVLF